MLFWLVFTSVGCISADAVLTFFCPSLRKLPPVSSLCRLGSEQRRNPRHALPCAKGTCQREKDQGTVLRNSPVCKATQCHRGIIVDPGALTLPSEDCLSTVVGLSPSRVSDLCWGVQTHSSLCPGHRLFLWGPTCH